MNLALHGDPLERDNTDFISTSLQGYVGIWSEYIGNDGESRPAPTPGVTPSDDRARTRQLTGQYIYTVLESLLSLRRLASRPLPQANSTADNLLDVADTMLLAHANMGRIRDQVKKLGELWKVPDLANKLETYYQARNTVLHGSKVPFSIIQGATIIALPTDDDGNTSKWSDKRSTWADSGNTEREFLAKYLTEAACDLATHLNVALEAVYAQKIKPYLKDSGFPSLPEPPAGSSTLIPSGNLP